MPIDQVDEDRDVELDIEPRREQRAGGVVPAASPVQRMQRSLGNARLIQMRRALQCQQMPAQDAPDWVKSGLNLDARGTPMSTEVADAAEPGMAALGGGEALPSAVRQRAEKHLGVSLDGVSVAHGADSACKPIQAQAFTADDGGGRHTVALSSDVDLNSQDGQFTLMHELAHVAQQKRGEASELRGLGGDENSRGDLEQRADDVAGRILSGK